MTEPTIAEVLAKYPDCKEFVDARGKLWIKEGVFLESKEGFNSVQIEIPSCFTDKMAIPGLRPRFNTRKVTLDVFLDVDRATGNWTHMSDTDSIDRKGLPRVPAKLSYEIHEHFVEIDLQNQKSSEERIAELERTEIKLRESCQRLGERNRRLEDLKTKADQLAEDVTQPHPHYPDEYEASVFLRKDAAKYLEASKELDNE